MRTRLVNLFVGLTVSVAALAQPQTQESFTMNLQQCIDYGIQNQISYKNSKYDELSSKAKIGEIRAIGLPQANITGQFLVTKQVQRQFVPASAFSSLAGPGTPTPPDDQLSGLGFATPYAAVATLNVTQLIFDGSFFIGLKAANVLAELSSKSVEQSEIQLIENITKAYYLVQINNERGKIYETNIARIDSTLRTTKVMFDRGFVEGIDVSRLQVSLNNLMVEKQKFELLNQLSLAALKLQMGMPQDAKLILDGKISDIAVDTSGINPSKSEFDYNSRIEYRLLKTQRDLQTYDIKNLNFGYAPRLSGFGNYGLNAATTKLDKWTGNLINTSGGPSGNASGEFFNFGLMLNVPVFDGLSKSYKIQQSKIALLKAENNLKNIQNTIDFQLIQSANTLKNSVKSLGVQKNNMDLSEQVAKITRIKYEKGIGSNIELVTAEAALKESLVNYFNAFYDFIVAKIDYDKANGNLKK